MARKNVFEVSREGPTGDTQRSDLGRPLLGSARSTRMASSVGALSKSLENINSRAGHAEEIEKKLAEGMTVVELDPAVIDSSIVIDRLGVDEEEQSGLVEQIREHGQQVPILVRPDPQTNGRYQLAYGHRRLAAVKALGRAVKAVVKNLTDEQLVVSQGQENNSRTNLSFIERCFFAYRLEDRGFSRETIMASLGIDKAALSRMISLVRRLPSELIEAIGPSPSFGRQRWKELADLAEEKGKKARALKLIREPDFLSQRSDDRFQSIYKSLKVAPEMPQKETWEAPDGARPVKLIETSARVTLIFDKNVEPDFGRFVRERLGALHDEFKANEASIKRGE